MKKRNRKKKTDSQSTEWAGQGVASGPGKRVRPTDQEEDESSPVSNDIPIGLPISLEEYKALKKKSTETELPPEDDSQ